MATDTRSFDLRSQPVFTAIAMACVVCLYIPIVILIVYAFNAGSSLSILEGFSLRWFAAAYANQAIQDAVWRSVYVAVVAATISTLFATMAAVATTRGPSYPGLTFKYAFINQPLIVPEIVTAVALLIIFSRFKLWTGYSGMGYIIAAHTAFCIPFAYLPIRARLEGMDLTLERAAADLYATPAEAFRTVTLPQLWPGIIAGYTLAFVASLDDVVITEFIKSAGQDTLPTFMLGQLRRDLTPEVNAAAAALFLVSALLVTFYYLITRKRN